MAHYFSAHPESNSAQREVSVRLRGHELTVVTDSGVFSGSRLDTGTRVLLETVGEVAPSGNLLDLGCGWGPIALALALASPAATVHAIDVNMRALALTDVNAKRAGVANIRTATGPSLLSKCPDIRFDEIWSNPPIRVGKAVLHELLGTWLPLLSPDGRANLVVAKNLGSDSLQRWIESELDMATERLASSKGFRVLQVRPR